MNCRSPHRGALVLLLLLYGAAVHAVDTSNILIVDLFLNSQHMGETFVLQDKSGNYFVEESVLLEWQISEPWPQPKQFRDSNYYGVHQFAGATAELIVRTMELNVFMPPALMPSRSIEMGGSDMVAVSDGFGAYMDYELSWLNQESTEQITSYGLFRPVVFGDFGNVSSSVIYRDYSGGEVVGDQHSQSGLNVLELTYTRDDPDKMRSLRVGDIYAIGGSHGRVLRMGGIQLATNFETRPAFITYPLPSFFGETAVPTALDIYVDGRLTQRKNVEPGSYVLEDVPVVNGAGQLQVIARDALGRQQVFTQDFYTSTELLRPGLSEYSINLGALRENYGLENFQYGDFAASATWRYGLRENLTIEGHGEFTEGLSMLGGNALYAIRSGGTLSAGGGLSTSDTGNGAVWQLGFRQQTNFLNFNLGLRGATQDFGLVGEYASPPKLQFLASAGKNFYEYGSVGMSVVHQSFHDRPKRTIISANHSKSFNHFLSLSTYLSYVDSVESDFSIGIRVSMPFGEQHRMHGGFSSSKSSRRLDAEISRSLPHGPGYGYRLGIGAMDYKYIDAGIAAQTQLGTYSLEVRDGEQSGSVWRASASGSVAYLSGMTTFTRQIRDAFAVVNVGNFEGVRVYSENQEIGRTNKNGQLFVPGLRPYLRNNLRIEIEDLPLNAEIGEVTTQAAPYYRSGVVVNFNVRESNNVIFNAILPDGSPVPEGAFATINRSEKMYPVGRDGKLFLQGIDRSSQVTLRWNGQTCDLEIPFPSGSAVIAKLGDIVCDPVKAP